MECIIKSGPLRDVILFSAMLEKATSGLDSQLYQQLHRRLSPRFLQETLAILEKMTCRERRHLRERDFAATLTLSSYQEQ